MPRKSLFLYFAFVIVLVVGCTPSNESLQATVEVAIAQTQAASVTDTPVATSTNTPQPLPTDTSTPTPTNTSTNTPTPTITNTPTSTSTPTITPTPPGPVVNVNSMGSAFDIPSIDGRRLFSLLADTSVAIIEQNHDGSWFKIQSLEKNREAGWIPASRVDLNEEIVVAEILVSTPTSTPTNTPIPTNTPDIRAEYVEMDIRELDAYPSRYIGEKVKLRGQVFNIMGDGLQMWVRKPGGGRFDNIAVVVTWLSDSILPSQVYEDTWITVYGTAAGTFDGTNAYGGTITQPLIMAQIIEKQ